MKTLPKPDWHNHSYPAICQASNGNWYALRVAKKPVYHSTLRGKDVSVSGDEFEFLSLGTLDGSDLEDMFEIRPEWDGYSNTLTTQNLTDEHRAVLFNYWFHGGNIESRNSDYIWIYTPNPTWAEHVAYRAKRTPRESFVHKAVQSRKVDGALSEDQIACAAYQLFDAGFQEPQNVEQGD
jgi:hypothetical protein